MKTNQRPKVCRFVVVTGSEKWEELKSIDVPEHIVARLGSTRAC
jgi:hypothetical protein